MVPILVSTEELESVITDTFKEELGSCFANIPGELVSTIVDHYNGPDSGDLLDAVVGSPHYTLGSYEPAELFISLFLSLVTNWADISQHRATLEYSSKDCAILVRFNEQPKPNKARSLLEEYHHAEEQGDFYPERLRRAFEEIESLV